MADTAELLEHVQDAEALHLPFGLTWEIPQPLAALGFHITKFMLIELIVALLMVAIFIPLARRIASGERPRGLLWNMFEAVLVFIRDEIARPAIGRHDAERFLPFLWTTFFFVLMVNLFGMLPWAGSATGSLSVTSALAAIVFGTVLISGMRKYGVVKFWIGQVPHMDLPLPLAIILKPMIFCIEVASLAIKHAILAVRLFANMFAGHLVLAVILGFIVATAQMMVWYAVAPASLFGATALSMLELMVAFLQAYVFTFLSALFIGMAIHQH